MQSAPPTPSIGDCLGFSGGVESFNAQQKDPPSLYCAQSLVKKSPITVITVTLNSYNFEKSCLEWPDF